MNRKGTILALAVAGVIAAALPAEAYVGPGAGFALMSSFFALVTTTLIACVSLLLWPFRAAWRRLTGRIAPTTKTRRLVVIGFDGQDPALTDRFLAEGRLPNFQK